MGRYTVLKNDRGFTLIELLVVAAILAVMAGMAVPSLKGWYDQNKVKEGFNQILTALQQARANAVRLSTNCTVTISSDTSYYTVTGSPSGCVLETGSISNESIKVTKASGSLPVSIIFNYNGETDPSSNATLVIERKDSGGSGIEGTGKCVVVSNPLGMIRFGDYSGSSCINTENIQYDSEH